MWHLSLSMKFINEPFVDIGIFIERDIDSGNCNFIVFRTFSNLLLKIRILIFLSNKIEYI